MVQLLLPPGWVAVGVAVGVSRAGSAVVLAVAADVRVVALRAVREEVEVTAAITRHDRCYEPRGDHRSDGVTTMPTPGTATR